MAPGQASSKKLMAIGVGPDNYVNVQYADEPNVAIVRRRRSSLISGTGKTSSSTQSNSYLYEDFWDVGWDNIPILDAIYPQYERRIIPFFDRVNHSLNKFVDFVAGSCFPRRRNNGRNKNEVTFKDENSPLPPVRSIVIDATYCENFTAAKIRNRLHVLTDNVILKLFYKTTTLKAMNQINGLCGLDVPRLALHMEFEDVERCYAHNIVYHLLLVNDLILLYDYIADGIKDANSEYRFFVATFKWNCRNTLPSKQFVVQSLRERKVICQMLNDESVMDFRFRMIIEGRGKVNFVVSFKSLEHDVFAPPNA
uniref:Uncharacterized protein n=1 Tax=Panagrellus redivivus TaxID=6233 RepID=A0A7E4V841_PANRE